MICAWWLCPSFWLCLSCFILHVQLSAAFMCALYDGFVCTNLLPTYHCLPACVHNNCLHGHLTWLCTRGTCIGEGWRPFPSVLTPGPSRQRKFPSPTHPPQPLPPPPPGIGRGSVSLWRLWGNTTMVLILLMLVLRGDLSQNTKTCSDHRIIYII